MGRNMCAGVAHAHKGLPGKAGIIGSAITAVDVNAKGQVPMELPDLVCAGAPDVKSLNKNLLSSPRMTACIEVALAMKEKHARFRNTTVKVILDGMIMDLHQQVNTKLEGRCHSSSSYMGLGLGLGLGLGSRSILASGS
jgi:hypothetical protein